MVLVALRLVLGVRVGPQRAAVRLRPLQVVRACNRDWAARGPRQRTALNRRNLSFQLAAVVLALPQQASVRLALSPRQFSCQQAWPLLSVLACLLQPLPLLPYFLQPCLLPIWGLKPWREVLRRQPSVRARKQRFSTSHA